jgi:hypothetical protein
MTAPAPAAEPAAPLFDPAEWVVIPGRGNAIPRDLARDPCGGCGGTDFVVVRPAPPLPDAWTRIRCARCHPAAPGKEQQIGVLDVAARTIRMDRKALAVPAPRNPEESPA